MNEPFREGLCGELILICDPLQSLGIGFFRGMILVGGVGVRPGGRRVEGVGLERVQVPPGNWVAPARSYRSDGRASRNVSWANVCVLQEETGLVRKPSAGKPHARFDERDVETEHGEARDAPADEKAGNRYAEPKTTAHISTLLQVFSRSAPRRNSSFGSPSRSRAFSGRPKIGNERQPIKCFGAPGNAIPRYDPNQQCRLP